MIFASFQAVGAPGPKSHSPPLAVLIGRKKAKNRMNDEDSALALQNLLGQVGLMVLVCAAEKIAAIEAAFSFVLPSLRTQSLHFLGKCESPQLFGTLSKMTMMLAPFIFRYS